MSKGEKRVLVPRSLLFRLISYAVQHAAARVRADANNAMFHVESTLMDAAHARLLIERSNGRGRR